MMRQPNHLLDQLQAERFRSISLTSLSTTLAFLLSACGGGEKSSGNISDGASVALYDLPEDALVSTMVEVSSPVMAADSDLKNPDTASHDDQRISASDAKYVALSPHRVDLGYNKSVVVNWDYLSVLEESKFSILARSNAVLLMNVNGQKKTALDGDISADGVDAFVVVNKNGIMLGENVNLSAMGDAHLLFSTVKFTQFDYNDINNDVDLNKPLLGFGVSTERSEADITIKSLGYGRGGQNDITLVTDAGQISLAESGLVSANSMKLKSDPGNVVLGEMVVQDDVVITTNGVVTQHKKGNVELRSNDPSELDIVVGGHFVLDAGAVVMDGAVTAGVIEINGNEGVVVFNDDVTVGALVTRSNPYDLIFKGNLDVSEYVVFTHTGQLSIGDDADDMALFNKGMSTAGDETMPSQVKVAGNIKASDSIVTLSNIQLTADTRIASGNADESTIDILTMNSNGNALSLNSGVHAAINLGEFMGGGVLSIEEADSVKFEGSVEADVIEIHKIHSNVVFSHNVKTQSLYTDEHQFDVQFDQDAAVSGAAVFSHIGKIFLGNAHGGSYSFAQGLSTAGSVQLIGDAVVNSMSGELNTAGDIVLGTVYSDKNTLVIESDEHGDIVIGSFLGYGNITVNHCESARFENNVVARYVDLHNSVGDIIFSGESSIIRLITHSKPYNLKFDDNVTVFSTVKLFNTGMVQLGNDDSDVSIFKRGINTVDNHSNPSHVVLAGVLRSELADIRLGSVTLVSDAVIEVGQNTSASIYLGHVSTGGMALTLDAGTSNGAYISLDGVDDLTRGLTIINAGELIDMGLLGAVQPGTVTIQNCEKGVDFNQSVRATTLRVVDVAENQSITFADNTTIDISDILATTMKPYHVKIHSAEFNVGGITRFMNQGDVILGNDEDDALFFSRGLDVRDVSGEVSLSGNISTHGARIDANTVILSTNVVLSTGDFALGVIDIHKIKSNGNQLTLDSGQVAGAKITLDEMPDVSGGLLLRNAGGDVSIGSIGDIVSGEVIIQDAQADVYFSGHANITNFIIEDTAAGKTISFTDNQVVSIDLLSTYPQHYNFSILSSNFTVHHAVEFIHRGDLILGNDVADVLNFNAGISIANTDSAPQEVMLASTLKSHGHNITFDVVTLVGDAGLYSENGLITIAQLISGYDGDLFQLNLDSGSAGDIRIESMVGSGDVAIINSANTIVSGNVDLDILSVIDTADDRLVAFHGDVIITKKMLISEVNMDDDFNVSFMGSYNDIFDRTDFYNTGSLSLGDAKTDVMLFHDGLNASRQSEVYLSGVVKSLNQGFTIVFGDTLSVVRDTWLFGDASGEIRLGDAVIADGVTLSLGVAEQVNHIHLNKIEAVDAGLAFLNVTTSGDLFINDTISHGVSTFTIAANQVNFTSGVSLGDVLRINNSDVLSISSGVSILAPNGFTQSGGGNSQIAGNITSHNKPILFLDSITLASAAVVDVLFDTGSGGGDIELKSLVNGAHHFFLVAGQGDVSLDSALGTVTALASLTIEANDIAIDNVGSLFNSGVSGDAVIRASNADIDSGSITFTGDTYHYSGEFVVDSGSSVNIIRIAGGDTAFSGDDDRIQFTGFVDLDQNTVVINSSGGEVCFQNAVNNGALSISTVSGDIVMSDVVGGEVPLSSLSLLANDISVSNWGTILGGGIEGDVALISNDDNDDLASIVFSGVSYTVGGNALIGAHNSSQTIEFQNGSNAIAFTALSTDNENKIEINGSLELNSSDVAFDVAAGELIFDGTVNGSAHIDIIADTVEVQFNAPVGDRVALDLLSVQSSKKLDLNDVIANKIQVNSELINLIGTGYQAIADDLYLGGPVKLLSTEAVVSLDASDSGQNITITGSINDSDLGHSELSLSAGNSNIDLQGPIGDQIYLGDFIIHSANQTDVNSVAAKSISLASNTINLNGVSYAAQLGEISLVGAVEMSAQLQQVLISTSAVLPCKISVAGPINDTASDTNLEFNSVSKEIVIDGVIGARAPLSSLSLVGGDVTLNDIGHSSDDSYGIAGAFSVQSSSDLTFTGGYYRVDGPVSLSADAYQFESPVTVLTTNDDIVFNGGDITLADGADFTVDSAGGAIVLNEIDGHSGEDVVLTSSAGSGNTVTVQSIGLNVANGIHSVLITSSAGLFLDQGIRTSSVSGNSVTVVGPTTVSSDVIINTSSNITDGTGDILFSSSIEGSSDIQFQAGLANVTVDGAIGVLDPISAVGDVKVVSAHDVTFKSIAASSLQQLAGSGETQLNGTITTFSAVGVVLVGSRLSLNQSISTSSDGVVCFDYSDTITISVEGDIVADGPVLVQAQNGITTAADIATTADAISLLDSLTLTGAVNYTTGDGLGDIIFSSSLDSDSTVPGHNVSLASGVGDIVFHGGVGSVAPLGAVSIASVATLQIRAPVVVGSWTQTILGSNATEVEAQITALSGNIGLFNELISIDGDLLACAGGDVSVVSTTGGASLLAGHRISTTSTAYPEVRSGDITFTSTGADIALLGALISRGESKPLGPGVQGGDILIEITGAGTSDITIADELNTSGGDSSDNTDGADAGDVVLMSSDAIVLQSSSISAVGGDATGLASRGQGGDITFSGKVYLSSGDVSVTTGATSGDIDFVSSINGYVSLILAAGTGSIALSGDVGDETPLYALAIDSAAMVELFNVDVIDDISITATLIKLAGAEYAVTDLSSDDVTAGSDITLSGAVSLLADTSVSLNSADNINDTISFTSTISGGAHSLHLAAHSGSVNLAGQASNLSRFEVSSAALLEMASVNTLDDISITATEIKLAGTEYVVTDLSSDDAAAGSDIQFTGVVTLLNDVTIRLHHSDAVNDEIIFNGSVEGGAYDLNLDAGSYGVIDMSGSISSLADLNIIDSNGVQFSQSVSVHSINIADTVSNKRVEFQADVEAVSLITTINGYNLQFNEDVTLSEDVIFQAIGDLSLGDATDDVLLFAGGVDARLVAGVVQLSGAVITSGQQVHFGAITLAADTILDTTNNAAYVAGADVTLGGIMAAGNDLSIKAGSSSSVVFSGSVIMSDNDLTIESANTVKINAAMEAGSGSVTICADKSYVDAAIEITSAGSVQMVAADIGVAAGISTEGGLIEFDGAVTNVANANVLLTTGDGLGDIEFGATLTAVDTLNANNITLVAGAGSVNFSGAVTLNDNDLTVVSVNQVNINESITSTSGDIYIAASGMISGGADLVVGNGGVISIASSNGAGVVLGDITVAQSNGVDHVFGDADTGDMVFGQLEQLGSEGVGDFGDVKIYKGGAADAIMIQASGGSIYDITVASQRESYVAEDVDVESIAVEGDYWVIDFV